MIVARFFVAVLIVLGAALAACSGNFGSGTTPPNGLLPSGNLAGINPSPTPTPNSANNIVTYGTIADFQPLPSVAGFGGAIAFPVPSPKPSGFTDVAIGATLSLTKPESAPDLNLASKGKGKKAGRKRERPARALAYLTLLPTHDATLSAYPRIAIDVPRDIVTYYRVSELGLALYSAGAKDTTFRLAAAELDSATPPPTPSPNPSAPAPPSAIPVSASPSPGPTASGATPTPRPSGAPSGSAAPAGPTPSPTLPPQRVLFAGTATPLKLYANQPVVFALYALPVETPSPSPHASGEAATEAEPEASGSPRAEGSPVPTGLPSPQTTPS
jgi:hypothetical protein